MQDYLKSKLITGMNVSIVNPVYERIRIKFNVKFKSGYNENSSLNRLHDRINTFLNPWTSDKIISYGGLIPSSVILNEIELDDSVDFVTNFSAFHIVNNEIINRQKVEYLASYKQYLVAINKDRTARKNIQNPLKPDDAAARDKIEAVMNEPMYVDQNQVKLANDNGQLSWLISAGPFEAYISQNERRVQRIKYKSLLGEYEILCKDYWLANGTHSFPRFIMVKDFKGESFQVEVLNLKHYLEKESDLLARLKKWDGALKGKSSHDPRPPFLL
jgi:hypothetical protein